jgi:hypothetical protein
LTSSIDINAIKFRSPRGYAYPALRGIDKHPRMRQPMVIAMRYLTTIAVLAAVMIPAGARADDPPALNVEQLCRGIASQSADPLAGGEPRVGFERCMEAERQDREQLQKVWSSFAPEDRRHCVAETKMGGESSYTELITCLEMARDVKTMKTQAPPDAPKERKKP